MVYVAAGSVFRFRSRFCKDLWECHMISCIRFYSNQHGDVSSLVKLGEVKQSHLVNFVTTKQRFLLNVTV